MWAAKGPVAHYSATSRLNWIVRNVKLLHARKLASSFTLHNSNISLLIKIQLPLFYVHAHVLGGQLKFYLHFSPHESSHQTASQPKDAQHFTTLVCAEPSSHSPLATHYPSNLHAHLTLATHQTLKLQLPIACLNVQCACRIVLANHNLLLKFMHMLVDGLWAPVPLSQLPPWR